ncbi:MAG TPA: hypothetical protein VMU65_08275 [Candidatus Saccharimonadales bacterium]|nr:hypothetical protein [Candidatus Saccharimonadales bacterium]
MTPGAPPREMLSEIPVLPFWVDLDERRGSTDPARDSLVGNAVKPAALTANWRLPEPAPATV